MSLDGLNIVGTPGHVERSSSPRARYTKAVSSADAPPLYQTESVGIVLI